jgi:hypothetical protein
MKVVVVIDRPEDTSVARRRAIRIVNLLADRHQVSLLSVWAGDAPSIAPNADQQALLVENNTGTEPTRKHSLSADQLRLLAVAPTTEPQSEDELTRLAELELNHALSVSDADVVVVSDARLVPVVSDAAPAAAFVVALHPGAPNPEVLGHLARADAVVTSRDVTAHALEDFLGASAPWVVTEPLPVPTATNRTTSAEASDEVAIAVCGTTADSEFVEHVEEAFLAATETLPSARLHVCIDDEPLRPLRRPISHSGRHGAITFGPHDSWHSVGDAAPSALLVGPSDDDESAEVAAEALSRGVRVVAVGSCAAADLVSGEPDLQAVPADQTSMLDVLSHLVGHEPESIAPGIAPAGPAAPPGDREAFWDDFLEQLAQGKSPAASRGERRLGVEAALAFPIDPLAAPKPGPGLRKAEEGLAADQPNLVRWRGRLSEVHDTQLEREIWYRNLHDVVSVLEQADISHILVSDQFEPGRIAVSEDDRASVTSALARGLRDAPFYVDLLDDLGEARGTLLARQVEDAAAAPAMIVYRSVVTTSRTLFYGPEQGCAVEFWAQDAATQHFMSPPVTPSRRGFALRSLAPDATVTVGDRDVATTRDMLEPTNDDIAFPIDFVWTWLDDGDTEWRERRDEHLLASGGRLSDPHVAARFVNRDELRYSMRSVAMYAPWFRHLYVVTDRQVPSWLDASHPDVTVVDHREIFRDPAALPTFNSHAIECQLHHIPGLSEHFVYFNDDFFLGQMLHPRKFFTPVGQAVAFQSGVFIPPGPQDELDRLFFAYRKNDRDLFARAYGRMVVHSYLHAPYALRVSVMDELEKKFPEEWRETMHSRFRSLSDHAFATVFVQACGVEAGKFVHGEVRSRYVKAGTREHQPLMREILARRHLETFCLNDTGENDLPAEEHDSAMAAFMEAYFPVRAPWEKS